jgi:C_GCAxxG_C_C family probable redox protein
MPHTCREAKEAALAGYMDPGPGHLNCAQAVLFFALLAMDQDPESVALAGYMGGGMARMGEICGALSGAALALGVRKLTGGEPGAKDPEETFAFLQELFRDFEEEFGALGCRSLLGCDISTPRGFREAKKTNALGRCPQFVTWTMDRLAGFICAQPAG